MRTANDLPLRSAHQLPNPLASHTPALPDDSRSASAMPPSQNLDSTPNPATSPRPGTSAAHTHAARSIMDDTTPTARPASHGAQSARPSMLRAKSDFGPRQPAHAPESNDENSVDGHFKIRHGWDDQLNSEEYSNLLTSVCNFFNLLSCARLTECVELLHVLYRQEA